MLGVGGILVVGGGVVSGSGTLETTLKLRWVRIFSGPRCSMQLSHKNDKTT